jgi:arsenate reductase
MHLGNEAMTESPRRYHVAFICIKNSCRSQVAEALAKSLAPGIIDPVSGGTDPAEEVDPGAVAAMKELGIDISQARPKQLPAEALASLDLVVHMGCGAPGMCLIVPGIPSEDWGVEDPAGGPAEKYREMVKVIREKVLDLTARLRSGRLPPSSLKFTLGLSL